MKNPYCSVRSWRITHDLTKVGLTMLMVIAFVTNGRAANTYYTEAPASDEVNAGSSIENLNRLSSRLDAADQWLAFAGNETQGENRSQGNSTDDCPCPGDDSAPVLSVSDQVIAVQCPEDVLDAPDATATDDCDGDVDVQQFILGGPQGQTSCISSDAIGTNPAIWTLWLPSLPDGFSENWLAVGEGSFEIYDDNTALLHGEVVSDVNPNRGFRYHVKLEGNYSWEQWNSMFTVTPPMMNRTYKDFEGIAASLGTDVWETWQYYTIDTDEAYLTGTGELEGSYLYLETAPSSLLFGAQLGEAANNVNSNYGLSTWFSYEGLFFNEDGELVEQNGIGDFNIDLDCGQPSFQCSTDIDYTYIAVDACGNASTATITYDVEDTTGPELFGCPADMEVNCGEVPAAAVVTAIDNCIGEVEVTFNEQMTAGVDCPQEMTITRVWAAEDSCGNRSECQQIINVIDEQAPTFDNLPDNMTIECGMELPVMDDVTGSDNCDDNPMVTVSSGSSTFADCPAVEVITYSYSVVDACGNSDHDSRTVTINDTTAPSITCPADASVECGTSTDPSVTGTAIASDDCQNATVDYTDGPISGVCPQSFVRTWTAVDDCGNTSSCDQTITINDTTAPVITPGSTGVLVIECDEDEDYEVIAPTATDICDSDVTITENIEDNSGNACAGSIVYTWTAIDDCDNSSEVSFTVVFVDSEAPEFDNCPEDAQYACIDEVPDAPSLTATDNCDEDVDVFFFELDRSDAENCIANDLEVTGTEGSGDYWSVWLPGLPDGISDQFVWTEEGATLYKSDDELLVVGTVENLDDASKKFEVYFKANNGTDWDGWSSQLTTQSPFLNRSFKDDNGFAAAGGDLWTTWDFYEVDETSSVLVGKEDLAGVVLSLRHAPENRLFGAQIGESANNKSEGYGLSSWFYWTGTFMGEEYTGVGDISSNGDCNNPSSACGYDITRIWTAYDDCGNVSMCEQTINIIDDVAPMIECPADITVECDESTEPSMTGEATGSDNCGSVTITYIDGPITGSCPSQFTRVWTAEDECENRTECEQIISIDDTMAPMLTVAEDLNLDCSEDIPVAASSATDNCDDNVMIDVQEEILPTGCPQSYTIVRTYTATDDCDNVTTDTQTIVITDTTAPTLTINADETVECGVEFDFVGAETSDDCGMVTLEIDSAFVADCGATGVWTITYTAMDECGNTSSDEQTITIIDTTAPELTVGADETIACTDEVPAQDFVASDICSEASVVVEEMVIPGDCPQERTIVRTYTATDECDNETVLTQTITIVDEEAPVIIIPDDNVVDITCEQFTCGYDNGLALLNGELSDMEAAEFIACAQGLFGEYDILPTDVTDNCDEDATWEPGLFIPIVWEECTEYEGSTNVKVSFVCWFNATDACGNMADSVYTVLNIVDFEAPVFVGIPEDTTAECDDIDRTDEVSAFDDCEGEIMFQYEETEELVIASATSL